MSKMPLFKCNNCEKESLEKDIAMEKALKQTLPDEMTIQFSFVTKESTNYILGETTNEVTCFLCRECGHRKIVYTFEKDSAKAYIYSRNRKENENA